MSSTNIALLPSTASAPEQRESPKPNVAGLSFGGLASRQAGLGIVAAVFWKLLALTSNTSYCYVK